MNPLQSNSNMLRNQNHVKQQQEQQMLQSHQLKQQLQQRQMQQQLMQKQLLLQQQQRQQQQQLHQQPKQQQLTGQIAAHQMPQLHAMNDLDDLKMRQGMGVESGVFQQHLASGQHSAYSHQQMKSGASFPVSSPQLLQAASPQVAQHSSPQVDEQSLLSSVTKTGTPLLSANSLSVVPSLSTPMAPSPMPGDSEIPTSGASTLSNVGNIVHQQQQLHQQPKQQQLTGQIPEHQMPQLHAMNDSDDLKMRQGMGVESGDFQQHLASGQHSTYSHQQMKSGASFPVSSPQLLQALSPCVAQHSSPQADEQSLLSSVTKTGTPLLSANSLSVVPSLSTPMAPSPMPEDSEIPTSGASTLSNVGNIVHQQTASAQIAAPSLAIGTPGISASPLLAEFNVPDGAHGNLPTTVPGKPSLTEEPIERLLKAVKSMSSKSLGAAVSEIGSVVTMTDRITGSAPGNGFRAAVGEDLVEMTRNRRKLQARNFLAQDGPRKMMRYTSAMPLTDDSTKN